MSPARLYFDEQEFARDVAVGHMGVKALARKHGMCRGYAHKLIKGQHRPDVAQLIAELRADLEATTKRETRRQLALLESKAVRTLDRAMDRPHTTVGLKAAQEVLNRMLDRPPVPLEPSWSYEPYPTPEEEQRTIVEVREPPALPAGDGGP
jgi:hypothetical protein